MRIRFRSAYQGSALYETGPDWRWVVEIRYRAFTDTPFPDNDVFMREIVPAVGTIRNYHNTTEWPDAMVCAEFPEYVPARYDPIARSIEVKRQPNIGRDKHGYYAVDTREGNIAHGSL